MQQYEMRSAVVAYPSFGLDALSRPPRGGSSYGARTPLLMDSDSAPTSSIPTEFAPPPQHELASIGSDATIALHALRSRHPSYTPLLVERPTQPERRGWHLGTFVLSRLPRAVQNDIEAAAQQMPFYIEQYHRARQSAHPSLAQLPLRRAAYEIRVTSRSVLYHTLEPSLIWASDVEHGVRRWIRYRRWRIGLALGFNPPSPYGAAVDHALPPEIRDQGRRPRKHFQLIRAAGRRIAAAYNRLDAGGRLLSQGLWRDPFEGYYTYARPVMSTAKAPTRPRPAALSPVFTPPPARPAQAAVAAQAGRRRTSHATLYTSYNAAQRNRVSPPEAPPQIRYKRFQIMSPDGRTDIHVITGAEPALERQVSLWRQLNMRVQLLDEGPLSTYREMTYTVRHLV